MAAKPEVNIKPSLNPVKGPGLPAESRRYSVKVGPQTSVGAKQR